MKTAKTQIVIGGRPVGMPLSETQGALIVRWLDSDGVPEALTAEAAHLLRLLNNAREGLWAAAEALGSKSQKRAYDTVAEALRRSDPEE
jgi:hypothetical protein